MSEPAFSRNVILRGFEVLSSELARREFCGRLFVVGGAAMALAYAARRVTRDVDAIFEPTAAIYEAARAVAEQLDLPDDWLNDAVKGFMPGPDEAARAMPYLRGIEITIASPSYLLAMKLMAMRFGEDDEDIQVLLEKADVTTVGQALELLERMYPTREPPVKTRFFLEEVLGG